MSAAPRLEVDHVSKGFGGTEVLDDVSLDLAAGELLALVGPSGSGKTTLGRIIAGFEPTDGGRVVIDGRIVDGAGAWVAPERRHVGIVPQDGALFPHLDVAGNVAAGLPRGRDRADRVTECLELVGLGGAHSARPHELSGGMQQRVALARALAPAPSLVILDEPFSALDASLRVHLRADVAAALRASEATALLITHDQDEALSLADRVAVLLGGRIAQVDLPSRVYTRPATLEVARFLGRVVELEADCADGVATTALGPLTLLEPPPPGPGALVAAVRPEQLRLADTGREARVDRVEYFGHDALVRLRLPDGAEVSARWGPVGGTSAQQLPSVGDRVRLRVSGAALAFRRSPARVDAGG